MLISANLHNSNISPEIELSFHSKEKDEYCLIKPPYYGLGRHKSDLLPPAINTFLKIIERLSKYIKIIVIENENDISTDLKLPNVYKHIKNTSLEDYLGYINDSKIIVSQPGHLL